ncbi:hypothetical protein [Nitrosopumilus sp. S6]
MEQFKLENQEKFLNSILHVSSNIRYVMIYDLKGNSIFKRQMDGVTDLLTEEENKIALKHTIDSWNFRNSVSEKIGNARYTLQVYDNLIRVIFPFGNEMLLVVTLDNAGDSDDIVKRIHVILSGNPQASMFNNDLIVSLRNSFDYWSNIDEDSRINCLLVWKKILNENPDLKNSQSIIANDSKMDGEIQIEKFLESWSHAIQEPNFESAKIAMQEWKEVWENLANKNVQLYIKILETLEQSWENTQSKSIE